MSSTNSLYRGGHQITIERASEFFTAILPEAHQREALQKHQAVHEFKRVFQHVYKVRTYDDKRDELMAQIRTNEQVPCICHHAYHPAGDHNTRYYLTDTIVVCFKDAVSTRNIERLLAAHGLVLIKSFSQKNTYLLRVTASAGKNPVKVCAVMHELPELVFAEPNLVNRFQPMYTPNDTLFSQQWHLDSRGGIELLKAADVDAPKAWEISRGDREIIVAVLDDGFDITHPDLRGDGKIVGPRDFADDDFFPLPVRTAENYHGTPCAGVAIAEENGTGVVGMAPRCRFMPVRFNLNADDSLLYDIFEYAGRQADVLSCSWGPVPAFAPLSSLLYRQLSELAATGGPRGNGAIICFAAGNYNAPIQDLENTRFEWRHPRRGIINATGPIINGHAAHPDVICVSASTSQNRKAAYSNWGKEITVAAPSNNWHPLDRQVRLPGRSIWTTDNEVYGLGYEPGSRYTGNFGGTSSSAPLVAGIAALIRSVYPSFTTAQVRDILIAGTDKIEDGQADPVLNLRKGNYDAAGHSEWFGYGKVNAHKALVKAKQLLLEMGQTEEDTPATMERGSIKMIAAMINPKGSERGAEQVLLLNISDKDVLMNEWILKDKNDRRDRFININLAPGQILNYTLTNPRLSNNGGQLRLETGEGFVVDEVTYTKDEAKREGWWVTF
ncbi:MAG: S8 family serine peptidase [Bacteroidota bacterium]